MIIDDEQDIDLRPRRFGRWFASFSGREEGNEYTRNGTADSCTYREH